MANSMATRTARSIICLAAPAMRGCSRRPSSRLAAKQRPSRPAIAKRRTAHERQDEVRNAWYICLVVALRLLLSLYDLPARPQKALAQHPGPEVVFLPPVEDET